MSIPMYPAYKPSGAARLGNLPAHWAVVRLKNVLLQRITDGPHTTPSFQEDGVPFLSVDGIQHGELRFDGCRFISESDHLEYRKKALPRRDDLLMGKAASTGKIARVKVDFEFSIWSPLALIRVDQASTLSAFVEYALKCPIAQAQIDDLCTSNTQKNISMDDIPRLMFARPPLAEQVTITTFLDHETAKIDSLVEEQRHLIALLKEKRQAVISLAVTQGLEANVPMKESGVVWLGEVPSHWEVKRFGDACSSISTGPFGTALGSADYFSGGIPVINPSHIVDHRIVPDDEVSVADDTAERLSAWTLRAGDIVVARRGELGRAAVVTPESDGWICGTGSLRVTPNANRATADFLHAILQSRYAREWLNQESVGSTMANLNEGILARLPIALPPTISEQLELSRALERRLAEIAGVERSADSCVELLLERRSALISAAVTGKIDVRGVVPQPEAVSA